VCTSKIYIHTQGKLHPVASRHHDSDGVLGGITYDGDQNNAHKQIRPPKDPLRLLDFVDQYPADKSQQDGSQP